MVLSAIVSKTKAPMSAEDEMISDDIDPNILVRPSAGKGVDIVKFGMRAMNFYGTDLKRHTFSLDMVMSIRWNDPRVKDLIPEGLDKLSMGWTQATEVMWMPGIVVSNRDIEKYEIISASVSIYPNGDVHRVERANTRVMKKFELEGYPFDTQALAVNIASSKYMVNEVRLVPDGETSGVQEDIWGLYNLKDWHTEAKEQYDGELQKSRGILNINVVRSLEKYSQDHLLPASIVLMISWAVFYFPFANPFITARLCLSILALLTFTNLMVKSSKELPGAAPFNWNDLFNQQIQTLMFVTIVLNIASEIAFHQFHQENLARGMNHEAKILMPVMSLINIILILGSGRYHWMTLQHSLYATKGILVFLIGVYAAYNVYGAQNPHCKKPIAEAIINLTPRTPREVDPETLEEVPPSYATLSIATLTVAEAVIKTGADEGQDEDCDM